MSNIFKIIFNFGNALRFGATWGLYMTPAVATLLQCTSLIFIGQIGNNLVRISLVAFLLWRLRQICNNKLDNWISMFLLLIRVGFSVNN